MSSRTTQQPMPRLPLRIAALLPLAILVFVAAQLPAPASAATNPMSWSAPTAIDSGHRLTGLTCPETGALCAAVDDAGHVLSGTNPSGGAGAWTTATIDGTTALSGVSCAKSLCAASDGRGNILTSPLDPTSGASDWSSQAIDPGNVLVGISCPALDFTTPQYCLAVDHAGDVVVSTGNPKGGSSEWSVSHVDEAGGHFTAVTCSDFSSWCAAVDDLGNIVSTTDIAAGSITWTTTHIDDHGLTAVGCELTTYCAATDTAGNVVTSTHLSGGASEWHLASIDDHSLSGLACPYFEGVPLCIAIDGAGDALGSTNSTGGASQWASSDIDGSTPLTAVACSSGELCVAGDTNGDVLIGTPAAASEPPPSSGGSEGSTSSGSTSSGSATSSTPSSTATTVGVGPTTASISSAQLLTSLKQQLVPSGKPAKIGALLKSGGLTMPFRALEAGSLSVQWYELPAGAKLAKQKKPKTVLVAEGKLTFSGAGIGQLKMKLTSNGKHLLKTAKRVELTVKGVFVGSGGATVNVATAFVVRR